DRCGKARTLRWGRTPRAYLRVVLGYWRRGAPRSVRAAARLEQDDLRLLRQVAGRDLRLGLPGGIGGPHLVEELLRSEQIGGGATDRVVHWDHDPRVHLRDNLSSLRGRDGELAARGHQQHVDGAQLGQLLIGQQVSQVTEMAHVHAVDLDREDEVLAALRAPLSIVEGADADDQQVAELVFPRPG